MPKILAVDDEPMVLAVLRKRLEFAGYEVVTAENGMEALRKARAENPDLVILDLILPGLNGYQICTMLKRDQNFARTPVIILSSRSQERDVSEGMKAGADAYLTKPYESEELLAKVKTLLEQRPEPPQPAKAD